MESIKMKPKSQNMVLCKQCNKPIMSCKNSVYCSSECRIKSQTKKILVHCNNCGKEIMRKPSDLKCKHVFCSRECRSAFGRVGCVCLNCGKNFDFIKGHVSKRGRQFCNRECFNEYKKAEGEKSKIKECEICGQEFTLLYNNSTRKTCSEKCHAILIEQLKHVEWLNNIREENEKIFYKRLSEIQTSVDVIGQYINMNTDILCRCKIHHTTFHMKPVKILHGNNGCSKCMNYKNENLIHALLIKWGYDFIQQYRFVDCKNKRPLPFDFYLKDFNAVIEYDGEGHYKPIPRGNMNLDDAQTEYQRVKLHDKIKTEYCEKNNIILIRIPYWESEDIEGYLFEQFVTFGIIEEIKH